MTSVTTPEIESRLAELTSQVAALGRRLDGDDVTLIGVTKTLPLEVVKAALEAGIADLGESVASEFAAKAAAVSVPRWHFIGQLQTNKVKLVAGNVALYQSVDRPSLIDMISRRDSGAHVLIQVKLADDAGRGGVMPQDAPKLIEVARTAGLIVDGVMGVAPQASEAVVGQCFASLRSIADAEGLRHCSMGMSGDFEQAVDEGSTMIRVGTTLFGSRPR